MDERRRHQRFKLSDACIINHEKTVGTVIDISVGGLSCMCLDQGTCSKGLSTQVDIYCKKGDLKAQDVSIKVLGTEKVPGEFLAELGIRRCRARFTQLDDLQQTQLVDIIVNSSLP